MAASSRLAAIAVAALLLATTAGAAYLYYRDDAEETPSWPSLYDRHDLAWNTSGLHSLVLAPAAWDAG